MFGLGKNALGTSIRRITSFLVDYHNNSNCFHVLRGNRPPVLKAPSGVEIQGRCMVHAYCEEVGILSTISLVGILWHTCYQFGVEINTYMDKLMMYLSLRLTSLKTWRLHKWGYGSKRQVYVDCGRCLLLLLSSGCFAVKVANQQEIQVQPLEAWHHWIGEESHMQKLWKLTDADWCSSQCHLCQ